MAPSWKPFTLYFIEIKTQFYCTTDTFIKWKSNNLKSVNHKISDGSINGVLPLLLSFFSLESILFPHILFNVPVGDIVGKTNCEPNQVLDLFFQCLERCRLPLVAIQNEPEINKGMYVIVQDSFLKSPIFTMITTWSTYPERFYRDLRLNLESFHR